MNWSQAVIIGLCSLNFLALLVLAVRSKPPVKAPIAPTQTPPPIQCSESPAGGPPKADDKSVIHLTQERDARILDGEEE
jgi:hypothetical protein